MVPASCLLLRGSHPAATRYPDGSVDAGASA